LLLLLQQDFAKDFETLDSAKKVRGQLSTAAVWGTHRWTAGRRLIAAADTLAAHALNMLMLLLLIPRW
jgi:hypothetical protein